jgi:4-amino-4-deoxy-L-arabinose transferase-like glycosyltransferase
VAVLIVASVPTAYHVASSGYIDLSLALYVTLATFALTRWWKEQTWGWVILIGIFLGAALSIKLTALFVFAAFALMILLRARSSDNAGKVVLNGLAALLLAGVIASPWYIRTWASTGSPVFPFYMSIWPGTANGWDVERSNLFQAMNSRYGGTDVDKINYLIAPVRVCLAAHSE